MSTFIRLCPNEDHGRPTRAVARLSWPDGPYHDIDACAGCRDVAVRQAVDDVVAITITPLAEAHGECPVCSRNCPLRMDGTIRAHPTRYRRTCAGRGQEPTKRRTS